MGPIGTFLLSIGLCLDWVIRAQMDTIPRPTLWAVPSPVVPKGADVTLRCQGQLESETFQLWSDGEFRNETIASQRVAEFVLRNVDDMTDARSYSCRYGRGPFWSEFSEALPLVVTGAFPKPYISALPPSKISPGSTVNICCQMPPRGPSQDYSFALLEAQSLKPWKRQNPARIRALFSLLSVRAQDAGNYSCIYYNKTAPYRGSQPSQALELTVLGHLPRPVLWVQPGLVPVPGANVTLWCSRPQLASLEEVSFTLWKAGTPRPVRYQLSAERWTDFHFPSVSPEDTGSYRCSYSERKGSGRASELSGALELVVPGSLPKPSLLVFPGLVVEPGIHVTLQCQQPPESPLWGVTFTLLKVGIPQPLQSQSPAGTSADFLLPSVRVQDAGNYSCIYYGRSIPNQVSEPSEVLEIWVPDLIPKASLTAWPGQEVGPGVNVTFLCQIPSGGTRVALCKEGDEKVLPSKDTTEDGPQLILSYVTSKHSGICNCSYQPGENGNLWTQPCELKVRASEPSYIFIITLSSVAFLFLLLCLLLLEFLCHAPIATGALQGDSSRRCFCRPFLHRDICLPCQSEVSRRRSCVLIREEP